VFFLILDASDVSGIQFLRLRKKNIEISNVYNKHSTRTPLSMQDARAIVRKDIDRNVLDATPYHCKIKRLIIFC
jgi:hypothetical protein